MFSGSSHADEVQSSGKGKKKKKVLTPFAKQALGYTQALSRWSGHRGHSHFIHISVLTHTHMYKGEHKDSVDLKHELLLSMPSISCMSLNESVWLCLPDLSDEEEEE